MDYEYLFRKICERRLVTLSKVESVVSNWTFQSGDPDTEILPAAANTFYFVKNLSWAQETTNITGNCFFQWTGVNAGPYPVQQINMIAQGAFDLIHVINGMEVDSATILLTAMTAGNIAFYGMCFKITTA